MRDRILRLLAAIDEALLPQAAEGERLDLHVIGKAAVILFFGGEESGALTSDVDVVQVTHPPERLLSLALKGFAKGTPGAARHGLYLESVLSGVPPLSAGFRKRCTPMPGGLEGAERLPTGGT